MKLIKKLIFCVAFISCSVYAQFFPYTDITIDVQDENRQFSVDREYYGTTPFYEFTITDNGSAVDLSGWDFALKYGYDKNADVLYTFTGSDYISVTNNKVLVNGTTNYWFEPHNDYYIALEGTYSSGNYKYIFAEGSMNVTYSPASDEDVNNILNGLTFTLLHVTDFVAYTNYINSTVRPEDLGTMAYVSTNDYATISITNNIVALEAGTNTWNSAIQPDDLGSAAYSNATDFATAAEGDLAVTALQTNDVGSAAFSNATDFATAAQGILANTALQTNDVGSAAFASINDFVSSSVDNLTAWDTGVGGVEVDGVPYFYNDYLVSLIHEDAYNYGTAIFIDDFDSSESKNTVDGSETIDPYTTGFSAAKWGTGLFCSSYTQVGPVYVVKPSWSIADQNDSFALSFWFYGGTSVRKNPFLLYDAAGNVLCAACWDRTTMNFTSSYFSSLNLASVVQDSWHYLYIVYDGVDNDFRVYVDGSLAGSRTSIGNFSFNPATASLTTSSLQFARGVSTGFAGTGGFLVDDFVIDYLGMASVDDDPTVPIGPRTGDLTTITAIAPFDLVESNLVSAVNLANTALQTNDVGSAAFASTNDFVSSSVDNLTAWNSTDGGGVLVDGVPINKDGYVSRWRSEETTSYGNIVVLDDFDSSESGNTVSGLPPESLGTAAFTDGKWGTAILKGHNASVGPSYSVGSEWGILDETTSFAVGFWHYAWDNPRVDLITLLDDGGDIVFSLARGYLNVAFLSDYVTGYSDIAVSRSVWYYFYLSYDSGDKKFRVYKDGVLQFTSESIGTFTIDPSDISPTTKNSFQIFYAYSTTVPGGFVKLDDLAIYSFGEGSSPVFDYSVPGGALVGETINSRMLVASSVTESNLVSAVNLANTALQTNDVGSAAFAAVEDFAAATLTNNVSALEAGTNTWNSAVQPGDSITNLTGYGSAALAETSDFATAAEGDIAASLAYPWYGVSWTTNQTSPNLTRTGNLGMHKTLPIQEQMYACVLNDSGEEVYILDGDDWTKTDFGYASKLDGTDGQVMVHLPEFYFDAWTNAGIITWAIAPEPLVGFEKMPEQYVSAFEASCYRAVGVTTNLASVINTNTAYRGGNNTAAWDGTESNLLGKAATNLSRTQFRTYARARGTGWEMYNYLAHRSITILFTVEYATKNSQKAVNLALDSNGFKQGGLGNGVTTVNKTRWNAFNAENPFVPCGSAISLASGTGEVEYTLPAAFSNTVSSVMVPVYRGIENPFGHIWKIYDGINLQIFADGEVDPSSYGWISNDPDTWNDANYTGYLNVGKLDRSSNEFIISMLLGHILPSSAGGSSDTYWCDSFFNTLPESGSSLRTVLFGGTARNGSAAGLGCSISSGTPAIANSNIGARLCYIPQN